VQGLALLRRKLDLDSRQGRAPGLEGQGKIRGSGPGDTIFVDVEGGSLDEDR
jgi:hypothetical protein